MKECAISKKYCIVTDVTFVLDSVSYTHLTLPTIA